MAPHEVATKQKQALEAARFNLEAQKNATANQMDQLNAAKAELEAEKAKLQQATAQSAAAEAQKRQQENMEILKLNEAEIQSRDEQIDSFFKGALVPFKAEAVQDNFQIENFRQEFKQIDTDGNGLITVEQLKSLMIKCGANDSASSKHIEGFYRKLRISTEEVINVEDFLEEFIRMKNYVFMKNVQSLFAEHDLDNNGSLDKEEYAVLLSKLVGYSNAGKLLDKMFAEVDVDNTGSITLEELVSWYFTKDQIRQKFDLKDALVATPVEAAPENEPINEAELIMEENQAAIAKRLQAEEYSKNEQDRKFKEALAARRQGKKWGTFEYCICVFMIWWIETPLLAIHYFVEIVSLKEIK